MTTIRRIYAYLMAFAGLAMLCVATANLTQMLVELVLQWPTKESERYVRDTVSLYGAGALVGLPVWLLHWSWMERLVRSDDQERSSTLRRLYLYAVLAGAMLVMAGAARESLSTVFHALAGAYVGPILVGITQPLPFGFVAVVVWIAHWRVAARDRNRVGESGGSATLRRWYVYGLALVAWVLLLNGAHGLLETLWHIVAGRFGSVSEELAGAAAGFGVPAGDALVGLGVWVLHWVVLPGRLPEAPRRDDGVAVLRSVYLFFGLAVGVVGALIGASQLLYYAVGRLLGVDHPGGVGGDLLQAAAGPASIAIVYGAGWAYQREALRRQAAAFSEAPRQAGIRRLYTYLVALVALAVLATGVAGLLWTLGDVILGAPASTSGDGWRGQVALFATLAVVGLPVWLGHWVPNPASTAESHSFARRLYAYLSLIGAMLTLLGGAAAALYRLIGLALGGSSSVGVMTDLAHALALAVVAALLAAYHWRIIRADARHIQPLVTPEIAPPAPVLVEIQATDAAALNRALSALRSTGVQVRMHPPLPHGEGAPSGGDEF